MLRRVSELAVASGSETRFEQLLAELARGDVSFCVVGSFALAVHGAPRASVDVDVVPETSIKNLTRLAEVLEELGTALEPGGEPARLSAADLGARGEQKLYTELGVLHLLGNFEGVPAYSILRRNALSVEVAGEQVTFCSRDDLVAMKKAAGRLIDRADLERLAAVEAD